MRTRAAFCAVALLVLAACSPAPSGPPVKLLMKGDGSFDLNGHSIKDKAALKVALADLAARQPGAWVVMQPDPKIPYATVAQVMRETAPKGMSIGEVGTETFQQ